MGFYINVERDVKVYIEDINPTGKKTVFFVHGWPGSHNLFEYQFNILPQAGFRCVGMDYRGFGQSDRPWAGYDYDRLADDIKAVVKSMRLRDFTLLGHSTGGAICIRYMSRHKEYGVSKLVLCAAAAPSLIQRPYFPFGLKREDVLNIIQGVYKDRPQTLREFGDMIFYNPVTPALSDWIFNLGLQAAGWSTAAIAKTWLGEEQLFEDMRNIHVPTLILQGVEDRVCLFPLARAQNEAIQGSRLVPFESCGHFLFYDQLDKFNKELISFAQA
jgi:non-heme chloroperoxidase